MAEVENTTANVDKLAKEIENLNVEGKGDNTGYAARDGEMTAAQKKRAKKKASAKAKKADANAESNTANEKIQSQPEAEGSPIATAGGKLTPAEIKKIALARSKKKSKGKTNSAVAAMAAEKAKAPKPLRHDDYEQTWDMMNGDFGGGLVHDD